MSTPGLLIGASYLLGSIPCGLIVARLKGVDLRKAGSGNIGATNVFRCVGKGWGIVTFAGDALKGYAPAALFPLLWARLVPGMPPPAHLGLLCGLAAIAGHNWPLFAGFKGGKGVATSAGALLGFAPGAVGVGAATWALLFGLTRYVSLASIAAAVTVPAASWWLDLKHGALEPGTLTLLGLIVIWRHRANIRRLLRGEELGGWKRRPPAGPDQA